LATENKIRTVEELSDKFKRVKSAVFTDFTGLNVAQITELRKQLRDASIEFRVVKNTLALRASKDTAFEKVSEYFAGPTSVAISYKDVVAPAKVIVQYSKNQPNLKIKGGILEGEKVGAGKIEELAKLPSREVLLSMLLSAFQSPISGFVYTLEGILRNLVYTLEGIKGQKESKKE
jgi:large subunit ribosomal protein L10